MSEFEIKNKEIIGLSRQTLINLCGLIRSIEHQFTVVNDIE